jgi:hypothetical protein
LKKGKFLKNKKFISTFLNFPSPKFLEKKTFKSFLFFWQKNVSIFFSVNFFSSSLFGEAVFERDNSKLYTSQVSATICLKSCCFADFIN